jgi:hypothetical protein
MGRRVNNTIGWIRGVIADELRNDEIGWSVYVFKPDDVNDVPCAVVDRPSVALDGQHHTFTTAVVVIGRRDGSADAQDELDAFTSWAMHALAGPEIAVQRVDPSTATIAELTYPSYTITVACGATICQQ